MTPPVLQESSIMPTNTLEQDEMELEEKDLLCEQKSHKLAGSVVQPQQEIEIPATENKNKGPGDPSFTFSTYLVQSNDEANGCSEGHDHGHASEGPTVFSRLNKLCSASGWKYPTYNFEEHGPPHAKLFTCKVTVYMESIVTDTVVDCFSEAKPRKKAAQEHAAQGALWCLNHFAIV